MLLLLLQTVGREVAQGGAADADIVKEYLSNPFVIAIWVFFVVGVIAIVRYLQRLPSQHAALKRTHENYDALVKMKETDAEVIRGELLKDVDRESVAAQRVEELHWISVHGGDFDQVALGEVLAAREGSKVSIARYAASVLVLLGLCGAVYGLSQVVIKMGPDLQKVQEQLNSRNPQGPSSGGSSQAAPSDGRTPIQESFSTLLNTMSKSLVHTRNAFYASLTGILLSVVLLFANWWTGYRQIKFLTKLEDLTATKLIPIFKPLPTEYELAEALSSFKEGSNYLVRLSDELDNKMMQVGGGLESLFAIVRKFGEGADALHSNQDRVYEAQTQMMEVVEQFVALTSRLEDGQVQSKQTIDDLLGAVRESNKNLGKAVEEWKSKHEATLQELQRAFKEAHFETVEARETSRHWISETMSFVQNSFDRQLGTLSAQSLEMMEKQQVGNRDHLLKVLEDQSIFIDRLQESVTSSNGHRELLEGMATTIKEERHDFSEKLTKIMERNERTIESVISEQKKLLDVSGMRKVEDQMKQFAEGNQKHFSDLLKMQEGFTKQLMKTGDQSNDLNRLIKILIITAVVSIPVFAALGVMFIFDLRPEEKETRIISFVVIIGVISALVWLLRSKL